jgi:hypothetical protein
MLVRETGTMAEEVTTEVEAVDVQRHPIAVVLEKTNLHVKVTLVVSGLLEAVVNVVNAVP